MRYINIVMAAVLVLGAADIARAGNDLKIGSSGAQELRIPVGSRGTALGGSTVALAYGLDALYWNPAGAAVITGTDFLVSRRKYIANIDVNYFAAARRIGDAGVLGFTAKILSMGDELITSVDAPDGDGRTFSSSFSVIGLSYARTLTDRVGVGINGNVIYEKIADQTATGVAVDIGFRYDPGWNNLSFGGVFKNLGPRMRYDGPGFEYLTHTGGDPNSLPHTTRTRSASFELPSYMQLGAAYKLSQRGKSAATVSYTFQSNYFAQDEHRFGAEYGFDNKFFLRGGYSGSSQDDYLFGLSLGAGMAIKLGDATMHLDYAWSQSQFFDDSQYFTLQMGF
ncbi:MAG: PorV/PorQ family protein [candidate division Zixibacteria bacterium]|nr:PorV/PorQ family protein [candidate division Zixibacteria bacterium]